VNRFSVRRYVGALIEGSRRGWCRRQRHRRTDGPADCSDANL